ARRTHPLRPVPSLFLSSMRPPPASPLFPYTTLFRSRSVPMGQPTERDDSLEPTSDEKQGTPPAPTTPPRLSHRHAPCNYPRRGRSEEHTSELQSRENLVCRLLLEKKKS